MMKTNLLFILLLIVALTSSCISKFVPLTDEVSKILVVDGMITDLYGAYTVRLSWTIPLGDAITNSPATGYLVSISDDLGNTCYLSEVSDGVYMTDPDSFRGVHGRSYSLMLKQSDYPYYSYKSESAMLIPVPEIDSLYNKRILLATGDNINGKSEACNVYLATHDPTDSCNYYRWDFYETWVIQIPYPSVINRVCWISDSSKNVLIQNASIFNENKISAFPVIYISPNTDRLSKRYSILVNQYSMNQSEFSYWERVKVITDEDGSLYDKTPSTIIGNVSCIDDPSQAVLGYFSVSSIKSKRYFIDEYFAGVIDPYETCPYDTLRYNVIPETVIDMPSWILNTFFYLEPDTHRYKIYTVQKGCADCTVRGTNVKPDFWDDKK